MGQNKDGRGNACPVTIIMPTLAMQAKEKTIAQFGEENSSEAFKMAHISNFMKLLDKGKNKFERRNYFKVNYKSKKSR